jgi:hypothetical protein
MAFFISIINKATMGDYHGPSVSEIASDMNIGEDVDSSEENSKSYYNELTHSQRQIYIYYHEIS